MHIKHIHCMIETLANGLKSDIKDEMKVSDVKVIGEAVDMLKDLCEAEYYARMAKWLEEDEEDEKKEKEEVHRMFYRGQPRRANGEYMSRRGRRGYTSPYYHVMPVTGYDDYAGMDMPDRMYYTGQVGGNMGNRTSGNYVSGAGTMGGNRSISYYGDGSQDMGKRSRYGYSHDDYMSKMREHKNDTPEAKKRRNEVLQERVAELADMVIEEMDEMTKEEQQMWRNKLNKLINS